MKTSFQYLLLHIFHDVLEVLVFYVRIVFVTIISGMGMNEKDAVFLVSYGLAEFVFANFHIYSPQVISFIVHVLLL